MTLGAAIKMLRCIRGFTQKELAEMCNLNESAISLIENDRRTPLWSTIQKIAGSLGVSLTILVMLIEKDNPDIAPYMPLMLRDALGR